MDYVGHFHSYWRSTDQLLLTTDKYLEIMELEAESGYQNLKEQERLASKGNSIPEIEKLKNWPSKGKIEVQNLKVKYREDLDYVLKGINFDLPGGKKVGVVGRTGAGKTTLFYCLYRYFDQFEGKIKIDGKEMRNIDLKLLRKSMTIIPQDPVLVEGTVWNNLDPLRKFSKEKCVDILKAVDLWEKFSKGIESKIETGGKNLSQGEKQLFCLARALLNKNKIVLMDEATANIDVVTESKIQKLLLEKFSDCTLFMIAHRLNTIMGCDKILVLENGRVVEYDDIQNLRGNKNSRFGKMLEKEGELKLNLS